MPKPARAPAPASVEPLEAVAAQDARGGAGRREHSVDAIVERITSAILEHRLKPGTKLGEDRLATIFGTNRARIREALARLAHELMVELIPQRGAFVARPTVEQARDVFEARRLIEPALIRRLIAHPDPSKLQRLRAHLAREAEARTQQDTRAIIRLSGEFHQLIAQLAGNGALERAMRELSVLTCLIISLYDAPTSTSCRVDEHEQIVDAIERGDVRLAEKVVLTHLRHIEDSVDLDEEAGNAQLEAILGFDV